jgi:hypothetical protein
MYEGLQGEVIA